MKRTLSAMKLLVAILVACAAPIQGTPQNDRPIEIPTTSAPLQLSPTQPAAKANPTPIEKAKAASTPTVQYSDVPPESGVLLTMLNGEWVPYTMLSLIDPRTGQDVPGYAPIRLGQSFWHTFSPDGKTLAAIVYPDVYCSLHCRYGSLLHLIDLQTWHDTKTPLIFNDWVNTVSFSPDGTHLAIGLSSYTKHTYSLATVDVADQSLVAQTSLNFAPRIVEYTLDGESLVMYGTVFGPDTNSSAAPRAARVNASDLSVEWESALPDVYDGSYKQTGSDGAESYVAWNPAIVLSHDRQALYIVHANEDKWTTVDFAGRTARTVEIGPARSWLEQLLALTAGVAYAKGEGVSDESDKQAVLSNDGTRLYAVGQTIVTARDTNGLWKPTRIPFGLRVIDVATGTEIARLDTEATAIRMSPDGTQLYLYGWTERPQVLPGHYLLAEPWTEVRDANSLEVAARLEGRVVPARRLDGRPILLASNPNPYGTQMTLAVLDAESLDKAHAWSVKGYASWLAAP